MISISKSIQEKIIEQVTLSPRFSKENKARRMIVYDYPAEVVEDFLGDSEKYHLLCLQNWEDIKVIVSEIVSQAKNQKMHRERYFDGYEAIANVYGLTKDDILSLLG